MPAPRTMYLDQPQAKGDANFVGCTSLAGVVNRGLALVSSQRQQRRRTARWCC